MTAIDHGTSLWVSEITTGPFDHINRLRIAIATVWTSKSALSRREISFKITLVTTVNRRIGSEITDPVIGIIPNRLKGFWILLEHRVFTIVDKATRSSSFRINFFKIQLLKWRWVLTNIVVETIGVVFLVCDIWNLTKFLRI